MEVNLDEDVSSGGNKRYTLSSMFKKGLIYKCPERGIWFYSMKINKQKIITMYKEYSIR